MDIHEALYTTRAMRRVKPDPIPIDAQQRILDAMIRAPSAGNKQDWHFMLVDDPALRFGLGTLYLAAWQRILEMDYLNFDDPAESRVARSADRLARNFSDIPRLLLGFGPSGNGSSIYPALWSAMLAARAEGVGCTLTTIVGTFYDREARDLLGVPGDGDWQLLGLVTLGYPTGKWGVARRQPVHEVVSRNGWEGALGFEVAEPLWQ